MSVVAPPPNPAGGAYDARGLGRVTPVPILFPCQLLRYLARLLEFPHFFFHNLSTGYYVSTACSICSCRPYYLLYSPVRLSVCLSVCLSVTRRLLTRKQKGVEKPKSMRTFSVAEVADLPVYS